MVKCACLLRCDDDLVGRKIEVLRREKKREKDLQDSRTFAISKISETLGKREFRRKLPSPRRCEVCN